MYIYSRIFLKTVFQNFFPSIFRSIRQILVKVTQKLRIFFFYYTVLKRFSFGPLLDVGLLVGCEGSTLISLDDEPLLGDAYARVFFSICTYNMRGTRG